MERWLSCRFAYPGLVPANLSCRRLQGARVPPALHRITSRPSRYSAQPENRILVRSQFEVPPNVDVAIGATSKSEFPGFENLPITFSSNGKHTVVNFLLSSDGNTVARLERFDISHSPADMISIQNRPLRGTPDAKVTIVNFDDLECPYCARMHEQLFPATLDRYKGMVKFFYKDYPLVEIHPWAMHAAVNANCLAEQSPEAYWKFVDYVHSHGQTSPDRRKTSMRLRRHWISLRMTKASAPNGSSQAGCVHPQTG